MSLRLRFQSGEESHFTEGETETEESQIHDRVIQLIDDTSMTSIQFPWRLS